MSSLEIGLRVLVPGPAEPLVDIVAVHGLAADPACTWVRFHPTESNAAGKPREDGYPAGVMWLKDLLPQYVPDARILVFNYSSNYFLTAPKESLRSIATKLIILLNDDNLNKNHLRSERPIVFIGHSFGGVVIKEALVYANQRDDFRSLVMRTSGVVFLGTPHRGSASASWALMVTDCASVLGLDSHTALPSLLTLDSERSQILLRDFTYLAVTQCMRLVCFFETRSTPIIRGYRVFEVLTSTMIVTEQSASLDGHDPISLDTNHSGLNKFGSNTDSNFIMLRSQIVDLVEKAPQNIRDRLAKSIYHKHFLVPYLKNDDYTPRETITRQVNTMLAKRDLNHQSRIAIHGLGGAGKTQFILNLAYLSKQVFNVFWIHGASADRFMLDYIDIAKTVGLQTNDKKEEDMCFITKTWLNSPESGDWLLFIDNADDLSPGYTKCLGQFLPINKGTIVFTTRDLSKIDRLVPRRYCITLDDAMTEVEAIMTFRSLINESDIKESEYDNDIPALLKELGYLPLAIAQAAAYIETRKISVLDYLGHLRNTKSDVRLLSVPTPYVNQLQDDFSRAAMTTWDISYKSIRDKNPSANRLLDIMSLLDFQEISKLLLRSEKVSQIGLENDLDFEDAMHLLLSFALVTASTSPITGKQTYRLHRLVSLWTRHHMVDSIAIDTRCLALKIVYDEFPKPQEDNTRDCKNMIPHVDAIMLYSTDSALNLEDFVRLQFQKAKYLYYAGAYNSAETVFQACLVSSRKSSLDQLVEDCIFGLATVFQEQGRYQDALEWYDRALVGGETALGKNHSSTLATVNNIANIFQKQGRYKEALEWYELALAGRETTLGKGHPSTLMAVNNIAMVFHKQGRYNHALEWYERALIGKEMALGKDHPSTLDTVNNIAHVFSEQGRYQDSIDWYERALAGKETALGKDHPSTLATVNNVAIVYQQQGRYQDSLEGFERALAGKETALGKDHPSTLNTINNIASVFQEQGKYDEALPWLENALAGSSKALGKEHPDTLSIAMCIAEVTAKIQRQSRTPRPSEDPQSTATVLRNDENSLVTR